MSEASFEKKCKNSTLHTLAYLKSWISLCSVKWRPPLPSFPSHIIIKIINNLSLIHSKKAKNRKKIEKKHWTKPVSEILQTV